MKRLFIANRGEIALRINRTAKRLGLETVVAYVPSESASEFLADFSFTELIPEGGFLDPELMVLTALKYNCDALHPGYGFLSESAEFSDLVSKSGITFVGPSAASMRLLGDKSSARTLAAKLRIPLSVGYDSDTEEGQSDETLIDAGKKIGFPLLIKAAAGGGGRGMRKVTKSIELLDAIQGARREALAGFGNSKLLLEKFFEDGRHIEVQVIGDSSGDVRQLGERDCSIQRRYQKLIEESPAPNIKDSIRAQLFRHAIKLAHAANLLGVSTVEFLVNSKEIIFLEVNTRLQVEHPVTEEMLGIDLVELQLRMAKGDKLSECLPKKFLSKAAIEVRIVSEGPDFVPTTGVIRELSLPNNIRIEHALFKGLRVTGEFDSLLGKIIAVGDTREAAIKELRAALDDTKIVGLSTNIDFLKQVLEDKDFLAGKPSAQIVEKVAKSLTTKFDLKYAEAAVYALEQDDTEPLRLIGENKLSHKYLVTCEGKEFLVSAPVKAQSKFLTKVISPKEVLVEDKLVLLEIIHPTSKLVAGVLAEDRALRASLSGKIISINCAVGEQVKSGQVLVVIESMKMEHSLKVKADGVVKSVYVTQGQSVQAKALLIELDA